MHPTLQAMIDRAQAVADLTERPPLDPDVMPDICDWKAFGTLVCALMAECSDADEGSRLKNAMLAAIRTVHVHSIAWV